MNHETIAAYIADGKAVLGIEFGSTRIKAVLLDEAHQIVKSGDATWKSSLENGVWTYHMDAVQAGLCTAVRNLGELPGEISAMGVSGMMHGYLAFDKNWNLLAPFRTWQNTMTGEAAAQLTEAFGFNIPQRWSIAHLYQAILNGEYHVREIAHITTLAGYVHFLLTGENAVGIGEASGMFPIDSEALGYDAAMLDKFGALTEKYGFDWSLRDILPKVLTAGQAAGLLTASGSAYLGGLLPAGIPLCPPEGDAGTGMTATNAVAPRTGNVSAGTSIFSMVVLEKPLSKVYPEIDMVTTPSGAPVAMVHCNNCTNDMNAWVSLLGETAALFGAEVSTGELFTKLYQKSLEGEADCSGVLTYNYMAGEGVTHLDEGRPMVVRKPESSLRIIAFDDVSPGPIVLVARNPVGAILFFLNDDAVLAQAVEGHVNIAGRFQRCRTAQDRVAIEEGQGHEQARKELGTDVAGQRIRSRL